MASQIFLEGVPQDKRAAIAEELAFRYPTWFFELLMEFEGKPLTLEDFQIRYFLDDNTFTATNKTRQSGGSMQLALKHMFKAYRTQGYRCDIVSINLREAADKIRYIRNFWESLPTRYRIPLAIDNQLSIGFHKGRHTSVINSIAASTGVRGGKKAMVFDEFGHIPNALDLFRAAAPAMINGNLTLDIVSTPLGDLNLFADIFKNRENEFGEKPYNVFSRHEFIWLDVRRFVTDFDAVQKAWHEEVREDMNQMRQLIAAYGTDRLKFFYNLYPWDIFKQEFCGVFLEESTAFFPWALIQKCLRGDLGEASDGTIVQKEEALEKWTKRPKDNVNSCFMGIDFGESEKETDKTSIQILERDSQDGILKHRYSEVLSKDDYPDFTSQAAHMADLARAFRPEKISCDGTGLGRGIVPLLKTMITDIDVEAVDFTTQSKEEMVMKLKTLMEDGQIWLQASDKQLHGQIRNLQRDQLPGGNFRYHGEPHDDMFWALALAARGGAYTRFAVYSIGGGPSRRMGV